MFEAYQGTSGIKNCEVFEIKWFIFKKLVNKLKLTICNVILCFKTSKLSSLFVHFFIFCVVDSEDFFAHSPVWNRSI